MIHAAIVPVLLVACACVAGVQGSEGPGPEAPPHWAFQLVKRPFVPPGDSAIDAFVSEELRQAGLSQNPPATRRELIRRACFDLIGLPPTPEQGAAFELDPSPDAFEKVVDRLLASPHYGERWGRHWLDLVRFAQSNGYERDGEKLLAWRYRDYVIDAFNQDKPYNRFVMEQIAGDELPDGTSESVVATAFQRLGVFDDEPDDKRMAEFDALDDVVSVTGAAFLGLTIGCARCHDHKTDPIPQTEYYSLLAFFRGVRHFESSAPTLDSAGFTPLAAPMEIKKLRALKAAEIKALEEKLAKASDDNERKQTEAQIKKIKANVPYEWTLAVRETGRECPATHVLARGNAALPRAEVKPAFPRCLTGQTPKLSEPPPDAPSSGRRRVLAEWIASPENPLTARVMVNRIWKHHFGEGLVGTTTDFGRAASPPSHPNLLDWLAAEFVEGGWSVKKLHKLIMTSATYRQSSRAENQAALASDRGNRLLWRQNLRRLEAESVRDSVLAMSGTLNSKMAGRGFFPHLAGEVLAGQSRPGLDWDVSIRAEQSRRSVYAFVRRTMGVPLFEAFDYSNTTSPLAERPTTTVAPQALMLLNDRFMHEHAAAFARRIVREAGANRDAQVRRAYAVAFGRVPAESEMTTALSFLRRNEQAFCALSTRNTFHLDVPSALSTTYFDKLDSGQFLTGPTEGWNYYRGVWAPPYEGIRVANRDQGPFALWKGESFQDGVIEADVLLSNSAEFGSLLFRAKAEGEIARAYELVFVPREKQLLLRKHTDKLLTIAHADAELPVGRPFHVKIAASGGHLSVWLRDDLRPLIDIQYEGTMNEPGGIGVRAWGGPVSLENLQVTASTIATAKTLPGEHQDGERAALESFCLLLLNLNELIYID